MDAFFIPCQIEFRIKQLLSPTVGHKKVESLLSLCLQIRYRTGANEATEIRILKPVKLGDTTIKEGTYTLYSYPKEETTEIIINSAKYVWEHTTMISPKM